jgi:2-succinyl-6-hydroxy-2,4-cyclohexadiene-1-carboxylate synthase
MGSFPITLDGKTGLWCLHGAVGAAADWQPFRDEWEAWGVDVHAVDLWRFLDCCPRSLADTATALNAEAAAVKGRKIVIGYSMGGRLALHALLAENSPWDAALIIAAHPGLETEEERSERRKIDADWSVKCHQGDWQPFLEQWQAQSIFQHSMTMTAGFIDRTPLRLRRKEIARSFLEWSLGAQESLWPRLPEIKLPVCWMTGERDEKFCRIAERVCASWPAAEPVVVTATGHRVPWEQPELFQRVVRDFLEKHFPAKS